MTYGTAASRAPSKLDRLDGFFFSLFGLRTNCPRLGQKGPWNDLQKYNFYVARGWESKSVEEQQAEAISTPGPPRPPQTPAQIAAQRQRQGLMLSRQHILQQLEAAQNPRHREILQRALADLDKQLERWV
jgi:hypothetical protein